MPSPLERELAKVSPARRRTPSRPTVNARISAETDRALEAACERWNMTRSTVARVLIEYGLRELGMIDPGPSGISSDG